LNCKRGSRWRQWERLASLLAALAVSAIEAGHAAVHFDHGLGAAFVA